jgi:hypothetical protein
MARDDLMNLLQWQLALQGVRTSKKFLMTVTSYVPLYITPLKPNATAKIHPSICNDPLPH